MRELNVRVCVQYSAQYTVSTQYTAPYNSTQYTVHRTQYTVHSTQCTVHSAQYTVHVRSMSALNGVNKRFETRACECVRTLTSASSDLLVLAAPVDGDDAWDAPVSNVC